MHPIEHLRAIARAQDVPQAVLAREIAIATASFRGDPVELVAVCRRIVDRQPLAGSVWTLCANLLTASDPSDAAWSFVDRLEADRSARRAVDGLEPISAAVILSWPHELAGALTRRGDVEVRVIDVAASGSRLAVQLEDQGVAAIDVPGEGLGAAVASADVILLEAELAGPDAFVAAAGSLATAAVARQLAIPVQLVLPLGRALPRRHFEAAVARLGFETEPWLRAEEEVSFDLVDEIIRDDGAAPTATVLAAGPDGPVAPELCKEPD